MKQETLEAVALCGLILAILVMVIMAISIYCMKAYFANSVYDLGSRIWSLESQPLIREHEMENGAGPQSSTSTANPEEVQVEPTRPQLREKLPKYNVVYDGLSVDVFAPVRESQVYGIARDYFQTSLFRSAARQDTVDVDVGKMDVFPLLTSPVRKLKRQRPKSIYYDSSDELPFSQTSNITGRTFPGMYMSKTIGPDGGSISIQGARLTVPVNALMVSTEICLGVVWESQRGPKLEAQQALLSSVVACEPHDLKFQVPVNLEISHCAMKCKKWTLDVMTSNTSVFQDPDWMRHDAEYKLGEKSSVGLRLTHFSQFAVLGKADDKNVATKMVMLVPFAPPVEPGQNLVIRVYCVDDYNSTSTDKQEVLQYEEEERPSKRVHPPQPLFIRDTGSDICITLTDVSDNWEIDGSSKQDLDFRVVWQSGRPACTFTCKPKPNSFTNDEFMCTAVGYQKDQPEKKSSMRIVQRQQISKKDNIRSAIKSTDDRNARRGSPRMSAQDTFPLNLRRTLIQLLEPEDPVHNNDWRQVANHLKLPHREIRYIESQRYTRYGPMEQMLRLWEQEGRPMKEFKALMRKICRMDVLQRIEDFERFARNGQPHPKVREMQKTIRKGIKGRGRSQTISNDLNRPSGRLNAENRNGESSAQWHRHDILRQTSSADPAL